MKISKDLYLWGYSKDVKVMIVLMYLFTFAEDFKVSTSRSKIQQHTGLSERNVRTALQILESEGVITRITSNKTSEIQLWRFIEEDGKQKKIKPKAKKKEEVDLISFVAPEHLDAWQQWLEYKAKERRSLYTTTAGAKREYNAGVSHCSVKVTDYNGIETMVITPENFSLGVEYSMHRHWDSIYPKPDYYGNNNNHYNSGRTTQQDAERIAAYHLAQASQPSISAEENRRRIEEELRLLEQAQ